MSYAAKIFLSVKGRAATYRATPDAEGVPVRIIFSEGAASLRAGRSTLIAYEAEATVPRELDPLRFATLTIGGSTYEIAEILRSPTPGLLDLGLTRIAGEHVTEDRYGAAKASIRVLGRPVTIDGRTVRAQVSVQGVLEEGQFGTPFEMVRIVLSVFAAEVVDVEPGAPVVVDGESLRVRSVLPDPRGLARMVLE